MSLPIAKAVEVEVKSVDLAAHTVDADVSSEAIDRDGEIILLSAWTKRLDEYRKNPLLCWQHPLGWTSRTRTPEDILGKSILTEVQERSLFCRFQYAVEENPRAKMCFDLIAGGYLRSYSIGAIPHGPVYADYPQMYLDMLPESARAALKSGDAWCVHTDMELLEVSNVFVGSNRDGLARACRDGVISKAMAPDLFRAINLSTGKQWTVPVEVKTTPVTSNLDELVKSVDAMMARLVDIEAKLAPDAPPAEVETKEADPEITLDDLFKAVIPKL